MLNVKVEGGNTLRFLDPASNTGLALTFQRTLRIPDDGRKYPLPPGFGTFPVKRVLDYKTKVPASWVKTSGVFIPMYQREALWLSFLPRPWRPNAVKVAAGKINAVSGRPWSQKLEPPFTPTGFRGVIREPDPEQDYLTVPPQPWLDGFNTGRGTVRQFVAMPLGMGYTAEGQLTGKEEHGGIQIIVFEPRQGHFPDQPPSPRQGVRGSYPPSLTGSAFPAPMSSPSSATGMAPFGAPAQQKSRAMGLGAGGTMDQKIYPDQHGIDTWDEDNFGRVFVHIVNSMMWREITGEEPPPTPVTARTYAESGYPWFKLYDEEKGDVSPSPALANVKSVAEMDAQRGFVGLDDNAPVKIDSTRVKGIPKDEVPDGDW